MHCRSGGRPGCEPCSHALEMMRWKPLPKSSRAYSVAPRVRFVNSFHSVLTLCIGGVLRDAFAAPGRPCPASRVRDALRRRAGLCGDLKSVSNLHQWTAHDAEAISRLRKLYKHLDCWCAPHRSLSSRFLSFHKVWEKLDRCARGSPELALPFFLSFSPSSVNNSQFCLISLLVWSALYDVGMSRFSGAPMFFSCRICSHPGSS